MSETKPKKHPMIFVCGVCDAEFKPKAKNWVKACCELRATGPWEYKRIRDRGVVLHCASCASSAWSV